MSSVMAGRRRVAGLIAAAVGLAASAGTAGMLLGPAVRSPAQAAADAAPPTASPVTVGAERKVLAESVTVRGRITPGRSVKLAAPAPFGADAVVTNVLAKRGQPLREGAVFLEVSGEPLFGLVLPFPLYRDLRAGDRGPDVAVVQRALRRLGYPVRANKVLDGATVLALRAFYSDRGYAFPADDGKPVLPRTHVVRLDKPGRVVSSVDVRVGSILTDTQTPLIDLDAGKPIVSATLSREQRALIAPGGTVDVVDEVRGSRTKARVTKVADELSESDSGEGFEAVMEFTGTPMAPMRNYTVLLTIHAVEHPSPVLAVPVTAVYSRPDGTTFVTVVRHHHASVDVDVRTGRSVGGWVEVEPVGSSGSLRPGTAVQVGITQEG